MSVEATIKKLQTAIMINNKMLVKVNTRQAYAEDECKFINKYIITTPQAQKNRKGKTVIKDTSIYESYSKIAVLKFLSDLYREGVASG